MIDVCFIQWRDSLNTVFENYFILGIDDLPDYDYTSCYQCGLTAEQTLREYLDKYTEFDM